MKHKSLIISLIISLILFIYFSKEITENFYMNDPLVLAHGSMPAGFNSFPGKEEQRQNENAAHVNPVKPGNKQVFPEYTEQP